METFGLLDFLKPLLALSQNMPNTQSPKKETDEEKISTPETTQNTESAPTSTNSPQNTFLSFLEMHESRANRLRKR